MQFKELNFLLKLNIDDFFKASREAKAASEKSAQEISRAYQGSKKSIDDLREYQFRTNRITAQDYVKHLQQRLAKMKSNTAEEKLEYAKIEDKIRDVQQQAKKPANLNIRVQNVLDGFARLGLALNGVKQLYYTLAGPMQAVNQSFLDQDRSIRKIEAAAKLTGTALGDLNSISAQIQKDFKLNTVLANEFTVSANKLTDAAGDTSQTAEVLRRLFDLAAGQGLDAEEALLRFEQAIKGVDEGTEALFSGKNPIDLYKEYGEQIGVSAGKMDDMQKKQAIVNAILRDGATLQGEYNRFLEDAAGVQFQTTAKTEELKASLGKLLNEVYIPLLNIANPILDFLNNMDSGTRNASIATAGFLVVGARVPAMLAAIRAGILALNASLGPVGWLILGIGAAATAWGVYASSGEDAVDTNERLAESGRKVANIYDRIAQKAKETSANLALTELEEKQAELRRLIQVEVEERQDTMKRIANATSEETREGYEQAVKLNENLIQVYRTKLEVIEDMIEKRRKALTQATTGMTDEELEELDKVQAYKFESNRISLQDYVDYLESRKENLKESLGEETVEYMKFIDKLKELQKQLPGVEPTVETPPDVEAPDIAPLSPISPSVDTDAAVNKTAELYNELANIETDFSEMSFGEMDSAYTYRVNLLKSYTTAVEDEYGVQSDEYAAALNEREKLDQRYQKRKLQLEKQATQDIINLGAQLMGAYQGQNKTMFTIGKRAAQAQALVNAYAGASESLGAYPMPYAAIVAAIHLALGLANVANLEAVEYQASGKKEGGLVEKDELMQSFLTPEGEDGIIGIQADEYVMPREQTREFLPLLEAMRQNKVSMNPAAGFARGGVPIGGDGRPININTEDGAERIIEAIRENRPVIISNMDYMKFYRKTYEEFIRDRRERRL